MTTDSTTVTVRFPGSPALYTYKAPLAFGLRAGDQAVVDAPRGSQVVDVVSVDPAPKAETSFKFKWIVCKVDRSGYRGAP